MSWQDVVAFWFDELEPKQHWVKDPALDEAIRARFLPTYEAAVAGELEGWLDEPNSCLAYVIVLDQFSRNMFRGTGRMFAADEQARRATERALERGYDRQLPEARRSFLYMPLMHSEDLADQDRCVELFEAQGGDSASFARAHRDIIARWGRFPHRNALLGRTSTPEELAFLEQPGSSF